MMTVGPAISLRTSCWLLPQNEQYSVFFESLVPTLLILVSDRLHLRRVRRIVHGHHPGGEQVLAGEVARRHSDPEGNLQGPRRLCDRPESSQEGALGRSHSRRG